MASSCSSGSAAEVADVLPLTQANAENSLPTDASAASKAVVGNSRRWSRNSNVEAGEPVQIPARVVEQTDELPVQHADVAALLADGPASEDAERAQRARGGKDAKGLRARIAQETLQILREGSYFPDAGEDRINIRDFQSAAVAGSKHYPERGWRAVGLPPRPFERAEPAIVRCCTTLAAMQDLVALGDAQLGVLNFASARNPGGGFTTGAEAQEESLARSSALYPCLMKHFQDFFVPNRNARSGAYTHDLIYTPGVPVIRDDLGNLLWRPYQAGFVTAAAPNLGVMLRDGVGAAQAAEDALRERIRRVLHTFAVHGAADLVLGAWGCGVFKNDPAVVASLFKEQLHGPFAGRFRRVVFAVLDPTMAQVFTDVVINGQKPRLTVANSSQGHKAVGKQKTNGGKGGYR